MNAPRDPHNEFESPGSPALSREESSASEETGVGPLAETTATSPR
jgi:hypothetical protein